MRISMTAACKQVQPLVTFQGAGGGFNLENFFRRKDKVVFVMGATGTGKSRLAIDLATRFRAEIVNSDKMQVYKGLDIATNKVTEEECRGIPHHLLGEVDPNSNFSATDFCHHAVSEIDAILGRGRLPIITGGSNSYIEALVNDQHNNQFCLKYDCCFLCVDVSLPILNAFVSDRVDRMVVAGLVDEVRRMFNLTADYSRGIRRAIGVPELDEFFKAEIRGASQMIKSRLLKSAIAKIKENTCSLARRQLQKIRRLDLSWDMHHLDATEAFLRRSQGKDSDEAWENLVAGPGTMIIDDFLYNEGAIVPSDSAAVLAGSVPIPAVAAATR
ncbi:hypothetical protein UlMin_009387 [Ulmus minor]